MILLVIFALCSLGSCTRDPYDVLAGWPQVHPPVNFRPIPPPRGTDLPPYHEPSLQSPIDIRISRTAKVMLPALEFEDFLSSNVRVNMRNTGSTVEFDIADESVIRPKIWGGPLANHGQFEFDNLHIHWGTRDILGGEHKLNGRRFAVEGHCVHFNLKYGTIEEAGKHSDGLAVVTFFGKAGNVDNPKIEKLIKLLPRIRYPNATVSLKASESLDWFAELAEPINYFTYPGSLTTAPYSENVFWIIYPVPMSISSRQVEAFRNLLSAHYTVNRENTRSPQPFNSRPLIFAI